MKYMSNGPVLKSHELTSCPRTLGLTGSKRYGFREEQETVPLQTKTLRECNIMDQVKGRSGQRCRGVFFTACRLSSGSKLNGTRAYVIISGVVATGNQRHEK